VATTARNASMAANATSWSIAGAWCCVPRCTRRIFKIARAYPCSWRGLTGNSLALSIYGWIRATQVAARPGSSRTSAGEWRSFNIRHIRVASGFRTVISPRLKPSGSASPGAKVFRGVLPRRWVVERTFAWLCQNRRFSRDYERLCTTSEALIYAAMGRLMLRRLARRYSQTVFSTTRACLAPSWHPWNPSTKKQGTTSAGRSCGPPADRPA
jgi:transposase